MANIAILIDAENIDPSFAPCIFERAEALGSVTVREIYGAGIALNEWSTQILQYAIHMNMTLKPNRFKNSSDIALVIGAMELLNARVLAERCPRENSDPAVDTVIIASSDSDFSLLSIRLRTAGFRVIGMGDTKKTNQVWPAACTQFIPLAASEESPQRRQLSLTQADSQPEQKTQAMPEPADRSKSPAYALSHAERVERIHSFIAAQLAENGGRLQASTLFHTLNKQADYRYDQPRSKRNPLEYLSRQYSDLLRIEKGEHGAIWIHSAAAEPEESTAPAGPSEAESAPSAAAEQPKASEEAPSESFYASAGISEDIALRIEKIFRESPNMFVAFNKLRSEFGAAEGRRYYQLVKEHRRD